MQVRRNRCRFDPWVRKIPWRRAWQPSPVFLPGESHRQRSLWSRVSHRVGHDWSDLAHNDMGQFLLTSLYLSIYLCLSLIGSASLKNSWQVSSGVKGYLRTNILEESQKGLQVGREGSCQVKRLHASSFLWAHEPLQGPGHTLGIWSGFRTQCMWIDFCVKERHTVKTKGTDVTGTCAQTNKCVP